MIQLRSLVSRLLLVLLLAIVPALAITLYGAWHDFDSAKQRVEQQALTYVSALTRMQQEHIENTEVLLKGLSAFPSLHDPHSPICSETLRHLLKTNSIYANLGVPLPNGDLFCNALPLNRRVNVYDREYFQRALTLKTFSKGEYQIDRAVGQPTINFSYPISSLETGEIKGIAVAVVSLSWWSKELMNYNLPFDAVAMIVDGKKKVVAAYPKERIKLGTSLDSLPVSALNNHQGKKGVIKLTDGKQVTRLFAYVPLFKNDADSAMMYVGLPIDRLYHNLYTKLAMDIVIILVGTLFVVFILVFGTRITFIRPLSLLLKTTQEFLHGEDAPLASNRNQGELEILANRFKFLVDRRVKNQHELKQSQTTLQLTYRRLDSLVSNAPLGVIEWSSDHKVILWSGCSQELFGLKAIQVMDLEIANWPISSLGEFDCISSYLAVISSGEQQTEPLVTQHSTAAETPRFLRWHFSAIRDEHKNLLSVLSMVEDVTEQMMHQEELDYRANFDLLTGLANRYSLLQTLDSWIEEKSKTHYGELIDAPFAVVMFGLDNFKLFNDNLGHETGDILLKNISERLKTILRPEEVMGRFGGDEFVLLIPQTTEQRLVVKRINTIIYQLSKPFGDYVEVHSIRASAGVAFFPQDGENTTALIKHADLAMYFAKRKMRGGVALFNDQMESAGRIRFELESELRVGVRNQQLELYYQPVVDTASKEMVGVEALVRWHHPAKGFISPADFIPVAEETGLIVEVGRWVLTEAIEQMSRWHRNDINVPRIAVNLSALQLRDGSLIEHIESSLIRNQLAAKCLSLEMTESVLFDADDAVMGRIESLRQLGIGLSLDDFGTGFSSLNYLTRMPLDTLKIDRSFVSAIGSSKDENLIIAIITMAHSLGLKVVAEGIETEQQSAFLLSLACDYCQGYLYGKPLPQHELEQFYQASIDALEQEGRLFDNHHLIRSDEVRT